MQEGVPKLVSRTITDRAQSATLAVNYFRPGLKPVIANKIVGKGRRTAIDPP